MRIFGLLEQHHGEFIMVNKLLDTKVTNFLFSLYILISIGWHYHIIP
jgi:hypothetical protein